MSTVTSLLRCHPLDCCTFFCGGEGNFEIGITGLGRDINGKRATIRLNAVGQFPIDFFACDFDFLDIDEAGLESVSLE